MPQFVFTHPVEIKNTNGDNGLVLRPLDASTLEVYDYVKGQIVHWNRNEVVADSAAARQIQPVVIFGQKKTPIVGGVFLGVLLANFVTAIILAILGAMAGLIK